MALCQFLWCSCNTIDLFIEVYDCRGSTWFHQPITSHPHHLSCPPLLYQEGSLIIITWQVLPACTSVSQQHIISHKQPRKRRVGRKSIQRSKEVMLGFLKHWNQCSKWDRLQILQDVLYWKKVPSARYYIWLVVTYKSSIWNAVYECSLILWVSHYTTV